jgi:hypothetical protein
MPEKFGYPVCVLHNLPDVLRFMTPHRDYARHQEAQTCVERFHITEEVPAVVGHGRTHAEGECEYATSR